MNIATIVSVKAIIKIIGTPYVICSIRTFKNVNSPGLHIQKKKSLNKKPVSDN